MEWILVYNIVLLWIIIVVMTMVMSRIVYARVLEEDKKISNFVFDGKTNKIKLLNNILLGCIIAIIMTTILLFARKYTKKI